jgi:7-keto-8-aminopelargonate synthetase-like enzyme
MAEHLVADSTPAERERVRAPASAFRSRVDAAGMCFTGGGHSTGVYPPPEVSGAEVEKTLREAGFYIKLSQYPSRPRNSSCARVAFNPFHNAETVERLAESLAAAVLARRSR